MAGVFPNDAVIRRVNAEPALLLGAGRALLLQIAHPAVAQGVEEHSAFRANPLARLQGTLEATYTVVFGSEQLAQAVGRRVRWIHDHVAGPSYRANDPDNLLWVHATLVDTALRCYDRFVGALSPADAETYYQEMARVAELFGLARADQPGTLEEFRAYFDATVAAIEVTDLARELAAFILRPALPLGLHRPLAPPLALHRLFTVGALPPRLRDGFGLGWSAAERRRFERACAAARVAFAITPRAVRVAPGAVNGPFLLRQARRRVRAFEARAA